MEMVIPCVMEIVVMMIYRLLLEMTTTMMVLPTVWTVMTILKMVVLLSILDLHIWTRVEEIRVLVFHLLFCSSAAELDFDAVEVAGDLSVALARDFGVFLADPDFHLRHLLHGVGHLRHLLHGVGELLFSS